MAPTQQFSQRQGSPSKNKGEISGKIGHPNKKWTNDVQQTGIFGGGPSQENIELTTFGN